MLAGPESWRLPIKTRLVIAAVSSLALLLGVGVTASTAAPVPTGAFVVTPNGLVGVQQQITLLAPNSRGTVVTVSFSLAGGSSFSGQTTINGSGAGTLAWTPNLPGMWTITSTGIGSTKVFVSPIPTTTILLVPDEVSTGQATGIITTVTSLGGSIAPSGTVIVRDQANQMVASGILRPGNSPLTSSISMTWMASPSSVSLTASFVPATPAFAASISPSATTFIGGNQTVSIMVPPAIYFGVPTTLRTVNDAGVSGGSSAFNQNKDGFLTFIGGSNPVVDGVASYIWTPTLSGYLAIGVQFSTAGLAINGSDSRPILVLPAPTPDAITITPSGAAPWGPGVVGTLTAGNTLTLTPASRSGNAVTLATNGPCVINAAVLTVLSAGACTVTASSLGNAGNLATSTQNYTVNIAAAPAKR